MLAVACFRVSLLTVASSAPSTPANPSRATSQSVASTDSVSDSWRAFKYSRASPSVRWPDLQHRELDEDSDWLFLADSNSHQQSGESQHQNVPGALQYGAPANVEPRRNIYVAANKQPSASIRSRKPPAADLNEPSSSLRRRTESRRILSKLALKKAKDWRERVQRLSKAICSLGVSESIADVLGDWEEQLTPTDMCFVLKRVGDTHWQRALELYEWLNLRHWYTPNFRMLAGMLSVLGRANQVSLAKEIFERAEPSLGNCVQVYNAMMSVYARQGNWDKVDDLLKNMSSRGCDPDLFTYNTAINARCKAGLKPGMAISLLHDIRTAGLRPDVVTYNTLISACASENDHAEAENIFEEMRIHGCEPDIWTYNAMISVYGRSGAEESAKELFETMQMKGFVPDAVTYNCILYTFARSGRVDDVDKVRRQMSCAKCRADEITYNTMISMYGKLGLHEKALALYHEMKDDGCHPDAVTFTVLIDTLGKAGLVAEAEKVFAGMRDAEVQPTLQAFSAMICAYAKVGMPTEAELTYDGMLQSGIDPDSLALSVMLDLFQKADLPKKAMVIYQRMVKSRLKPELGTYEDLLQWFLKKGLQEEVEILSSDLQHSGFENAGVCRTFLNAGLHDKAVEFLKLAAVDGYIPSHPSLLDVLNSYHALGRYNEAQSFVCSLSSSVPQVGFLIHQDLIAMLAQAKQLHAAKEELNKFRETGQILNLDTYRALIVAFEEAQMPDEVLRLFSDMQCSGVQPDEECQRGAVSAYCKSGFPESAHKVLSGMTLAAKSKVALDVYISLIEAYGKQQLWERAESIFRELQHVGYKASSRAWNALIYVYANCGQYEQAKVAVSEMVIAGKAPTATTCSAMLQAVINAGRLQDIHAVLQEMRQLGVNPSKNAFLVIFNASVNKGNVQVAKRVFQELKGAGYLPNIQVYKSLILLLSNAGLVQDSENMVKEMESDNFTPDITIYNAMLSLYSKVGHYNKAAEVFQGMQAAGCHPDSNTFNSLIWLYSRCVKIQEALALLRQMEKAGYVPVVQSYTALISACGRLQLVDAAEVIFKDMQETGCKPNNQVFHAMMNVYRIVGKYEQVKEMLNHMKDAGIEPTLGTFHVLMDSYGKGGKPVEAEGVLHSMQEAGFTPGALQHTGVINAYLKNKDHDLAIAKLLNMKNEGFEPDYMTWTSVVSAASLCGKTCEAIKLLTALSDVGFPLPLRLLKEKTDGLLTEVDRTLEGLEAFGQDAGLGLVNVLLDLLWGFQRRATAAKIFSLAIQRNIYSSTMARVQVNDWGADFRRLSAGAALVALTLWFDQMQDAALQGFPESSKFVTLVTGCNRRTQNQISVGKTLKVHLWAMGSPFLTPQIRTGVLIAKGHSLRMWLKDSPYCTDLELKNFSVLPETNSMQINDGAFMRVELVPALQEIEKRMGEVRPKKFSRLANMSDAKRANVITAELEDKKDMSEKGKVKLRRTKKLIFKKRIRRV